MCDDSLSRPGSGPGNRVGFGDYIVYADESGDHRLDRIDPDCPIFVLCLCLFRKEHYIREV